MTIVEKKGQPHEDRNARTGVPLPRWDRALHHPAGQEMGYFGEKDKGRHRMSSKPGINYFTNKTVKEVAFLVAIFAFSLAVRAIGIKHGFPLLTHPDEGFSFQPVLHMTTYRTLNTGYFNRPDQIMSMVNLVYLNVLSYLKFGENVAQAFPKHYLSFYAYARFLIAILGSFIPVVAYKIGKEFKPVFGIYAALVFAAFPSYVLHSLFITPDIPITLFTLIVMYFSVRYLKEGKNKFLYFAILFAAINTAEKFPGVISLSIVLGAVLINSLRQDKRPLTAQLWPIFKKFLLVFLLFIVALLIVAPFLFIEYRAVIDALVFESRSSHLGADNLGWLGNLWFYVTAFSSWMNILAFVFIGFGLYAMIKWRKASSLLLLYGILYWIILSALSLHWERWALPMYITPLFLIAVGINFLLIKVNNHRLLKWVATFFLTVFFTLQLITTVHTSIRMTFTDTREVALNYCNEMGITAENSLFEGYTPLQPQHPKTIFNEYEEITYDIRYIVLSSSMFGRYYREPNVYEREILIYEDIRNNNSLLARFEPDMLEENLFNELNDIMFYLSHIFKSNSEKRLEGPIIEIYQVVNR
jgi:4-amino-4-deoxy-L-arabinose transferase-like glycosyltransferase